MDKKVKMAMFALIAANLIVMLVALLGGMKDKPAPPAAPPPTNGPSLGPIPPR